MLYILAVIHLADIGSAEPDRIEPRYAYDTLAECWQEAEALADAFDGAEATIICLREQ